MYSYRAYGLSIQSEIELPELVVGNGDPDVTVRFGKVERLPDEADRYFQSVWATPQETCLFFQGTGAFLIKRGREILMDPLPNVEERVMRLAVLGPSISVILDQRGFLVLHGSATEVNGKAVSFLGHSGEGKSTMAAALHSRGHSLIADDLSVIHFGSESQPQLVPGFPQLKLWPETVLALGDNPDDLNLLHPMMEKRARRALDGFAADMLPLHRIYVLEEDENPNIEIIPSQLAFIEVVRYSFNAQLLGATKMEVSHFQRCTQLVNRVPMYRLKRPRDLSRLGDVAQLVVDHLT